MPAPVEQMARNRAQDEAKQNERERLQTLAKVSAYAKWENDTDSRLAYARQVDHRRLAEQKEEAKLHARRVKLKEMYDNDWAKWQQGVENQQETPADRKLAIQKRAEELKAKRQADAQQYVNAQRANQWRASCDDLRQLDSQATLIDVAERRNEQLHEKNRQNMQDLEDEKQWADAWEVDRLRKERRELEDLANQHRRNEEMRQDLDRQVAARKAKSQVIRENARSEAKETKERWEMEQRIQEEHDAKVRAAMVEEGKRVFKYNAMRQEKRSQDAKVEMQNDLVLLQVALEKERRELEDEEEKKRNEKEITRQYQEHLKKQMVKEKENTSALDALRREDEEKAAAKRDRQIQKEQVARDSLQRAVMQGRRQQMEERRQKDAIMQEEMKQYAVELNEKAHQLDLAEKSLRAEQQKARYDNQRGVRLQIAGRQTVQNREKQQEYLKLKQMQYSEKQYQKQLQADVGRVSRQF